MLGYFIFCAHADYYYYVNFIPHHLKNNIGLRLVIIINRRQQRSSSRKDPSCSKNVHLYSRIKANISLAITRYIEGVFALVECTIEFNTFNASARL